MRGRSASWDFGYEAPSAEPADDDATGTDAVVATRARVERTAVLEALSGFGCDFDVEPVLEEAPLFWTRVRSETTLASEAVDAALSGAGVGVRYVTSARAPSMALPPLLEFEKRARRRPEGWRTRAARPVATDRTVDAANGDWFLGGGGGIHIDRRVCGTGSGTRLAVIDDETADLERVELERIVHVGVGRAPATSGHAALMVGWAMGALRPGGARFMGVAPDASVRVYCIAKPGSDVVSLPTAIARAVFDGADVIVCATYLGVGATSPLLDDALEVACRLGRRGRGTVVMLPTGREASSPGNSVHASLSLTLDDPASDPRVHCVAPGGREGGWFLWRGPTGKVRPFSNRGPAVRWLAPGDDVAYPFASRDQLFHAESSGASAIAAGVALLVLGSNPNLTLPELHAVLARTVDPPAPNTDGSPMADPADLLPLGQDRDGHNARTGYGRLNAATACASASDPIALALTAIGEGDMAMAWCSRPHGAYSKRAARWSSRALLARPDLDHALRSVARHVRLLAAKPSRAQSHAPGGLARQLATIARELLRMRPPPLVAQELALIAGWLADPHPTSTVKVDEAAMAFMRDSGTDRMLNGPVSAIRAGS
jgi:hypothetical protein